MKPASVLPNLPSGARILLIRLRSLGDTVLLTPSLRLLKRWRPDLRVSVVLEECFRDLLDGNTCVEEVLTLKARRGVGRTLELIRLIRELRSRKFDLCVNLHGGPSSTYLARWSGGRAKAGFFHFRNQRVYDLSIPDARAILSQAVVHTAEHHAAAFFWLGLPLQPVSPSELYVTQQGKAAWDAERERLGLAPSCEYAILHPAALFATKQWPPERFAELGQYLEEQHGLAVIYCCGAGESACLDDVEREAGKPLRRVEGQPLRCLIAAIAGAKLFAGNDSGPAHIAAAVGRPVIVIFGSSSSRIWRPWTGSQSARDARPGSAFRIIQNPYDCNPCPGDRCYRFDAPECILSVGVEQVRAAADSLLDTAQAPGNAALKSIP
ncbi:MAG: glycosyltransferase family 9 protein [Terriglobia bacterium]